MKNIDSTGLARELESVASDIKSTSIMQFKSISRTPAAADAVMATIKSLILDGTLEPFQRLPSENELAIALGVSRPTVREAVRGLLALNILESRHGEGTFVTSLEPSLLAAPIDFLLRVDESSLSALTQTRQILETGVAELAAVNRTAEDLCVLGNLVEEFANALNDFERCIELDVEFHVALATAAGNPILSSMLATVAALGIESRRQTGRSRTVRRRAHADHLAIYAAIELRDAAGARSAMVEHLDHVAQDVHSPSRLRTPKASA